MVYSIQYDDRESTQFIIVDQGKIIDRTYKEPKRNRLMDFKGLKMSPGKTFFAPNLPRLSDKNAKLAAYKKIINQGGTSVVVLCHCINVRHLKRQLEATRQAMDDSPIDYLIGVSTPLKHLTQSMVIECGKLNIPFIQFEMETIDQIYNYPWEWVRDAVYGRRLLFTPIYLEKEDKKEIQQLKKIYKYWERFSEQMNIPTVTPLKKNAPLPLSSLKKIGLYPIKGRLAPGSDCDCVLTPVSLEPKKNLNYDEDKESIVVIRGRIQKGHGKTMRPGFGQEIKIPIVHRFTGDWECKI